MAQRQAPTSSRTALPRERTARPRPVFLHWLPNPAKVTSIESPLRVTPLRVVARPFNLRVSALPLYITAPRIIGHIRARASLSLSLSLSHSLPPLCPSFTLVDACMRARMRASVRKVKMTMRSLRGHTTSDAAALLFLPPCLQLNIS
jgi:hypothetical protein